jgi:hypothetical protein
MLRQNGKRAQVEAEVIEDLNRVNKRVNLCRADDVFWPSWPTRPDVISSSATVNV